jgi:hypothetical protein
VSEFAILNLICVVVFYRDCIPELCISLIASIEFSSSESPAKFGQHWLDIFRKEDIGHAIVVNTNMTTTCYCDTIVSRSDASFCGFSIDL